jgi:predicted nucleic acid-binding Zn finger protein
MTDASTKQFELSEYVDSLFHEVSERGEFPPEVAVSLDFLFGKTLEKAVEIVDAGFAEVLEVANRSNLNVYSVTGSSVYPYICTRNYCSCLAFSNGLVASQGLGYCKHIVAARLGEALNRMPRKRISEEEYLSRMTAQSSSMNMNTPHDMRGWQGGKQNQAPRSTSPWAP